MAIYFSGIIIIIINRMVNFSGIGRLDDSKVL